MTNTTTQTETTTLYLNEDARIGDRVIGTEAEAEMRLADVAKAPRTAIDLKHLYNGAATGRVTHHRVRGASGIHRLMVRESGSGWGVEVWMSKAAAKRLGVYVHDCDTLLRCKDAPAGGISVSVYGHNYDDRTVTTL
jgi:hypothetical protein